MTPASAPPAAVVAVPLRWRSRAVLAAASLAGLVMLVWPLLVRVPEGARLDPPFLFLALLPLVIVVVLAELSEGGIDARVLVSQPVRIGDRGVPGLIGLKPPHLSAPLSHSSASLPVRSGAARHGAPGGCGTDG